jgi:DNA-directed RNA polymerase II subunit RPB2
MVRSKFCHLSRLNKRQIVNDARECRYDQGGYFIVSGNEKVIIAQERMANNIVLVFKLKSNAKHSWKAEIRSMDPNSLMPPQSFNVKLT